MTFPFSRTTIRSASAMEEILWETISFVMTPNLSSFRPDRILLSVAVSTALVESSRMRIFGFFRRALAIERRCFCPPESWSGRRAACSLLPG